MTDPTDDARINDATGDKPSRISGRDEPDFRCGEAFDSGTNRYQQTLETVSNEHDRRAHQQGDEGNNGRHLRVTLMCDLEILRSHQIAGRDHER